MIIKENCADLPQQIYKQFLFAVSHSVPAILLVPDEPTAREAVSFFRNRAANTYRGSELRDRNGFYIEVVNRARSLDEYSTIGYICPSAPIPSTFDDSEKEIFITYQDGSLTRAYKETKPRKTPDYSKRDAFLENQDIRKQFLDTFSIATEEIDIICPWINRSVVNDELVSLIDSALVRGVRIKIIYGIGDPGDKRSMTSQKTVDYLIKRFSIYPDGLRFKKDNTHVKLLICDNKYMLSGSYNFLSFTGDYAASDIRSEAVEYKTDLVDIAQRRLHFFQW